MFINLKTIEAAILKNENIISSILKYLKKIKIINDKVIVNFLKKYKIINAVQDEDDKYLQLIDILEFVRDFKFEVFSPKNKVKIEKDENLENLNLKTEHSDDLNEFMKENSFSPKNKIKTNKIKLIDINTDKLKTRITKLNRKVDKLYLEKSIIDNSILLDLNQNKIEENTSEIKKKFKVKFIFSKKFDVEENKSKKETHVKPSIFTKFKEHKENKLDNINFALDEENIEDDDTIPKENEDYIKKNYIYVPNSAANLTFENEKTNLIVANENKIETPKNVKAKILPDPKITTTYLERSSTKKPSHSFIKNCNSPTSKYK